MSDELRMWIEVGFNVLYLIVVWLLTLLMSLRLKEVSRENWKVANLFRWAYFLLALGDSGHVGFRVAAYLLGGLEKNNLLLGVGTLATSITVTLFYGILLYVWKERFKKQFGPLEYIFLVCVPIRLAVMAFPQNDWGSLTTPPDWGLLRNFFLLILGVGVIYLFLREALKNYDRLFRWMAYCIFFSYLFYAPVILFSREYPLVGMLMIPKTVMYVLLQFIAYRGLWPRKPAKTVA